MNTKIFIILSVLSVLLVSACGGATSPESPVVPVVTAVAVSSPAPVYAITDPRTEFAPFPGSYGDTLFRVISTQKVPSMKICREDDGDIMIESAAKLTSKDLESGFFYTSPDGMKLDRENIDVVVGFVFIRDRYASDEAAGTIFEINVFSGVSDPFSLVVLPGECVSLSASK